VRIKAHFHEEAGTEYDAAFDWYLARSPDAARKFDAEVTRAVEQIVQAPTRWATGAHSTRRFLLHRFPFVLIYRILRQEEVQIIAVSHTSRRPGYWKGRL
jgi:toxin ParE1/3/4